MKSAFALLQREIRHRARYAPRPSRFIVPNLGCAQQTFRQLPRFFSTSRARYDDKNDEAKDSPSNSSWRSWRWSRAKLEIQVPSRVVICLLIILWGASEYGQGFYIGYYKAKLRQSQNEYARIPWNDEDAEESKDNPSKATIVNKDGYAPITQPLEIRVLVLEPGEKGSTIKMSLRHVRLSRRPDFEALSYVWGKQDSPNKVMCNGKSRKIGKNLHEALERLRLPDKERILWIDALCIDQNNNEEKTQQVRIMGEIYSKARRVLIWLGNDDTVERGMAKLMDQISNERHTDWSPLKPVFSSPAWYMGQNVLVWLGFHGASQAGMAKLKPYQNPENFDWDYLMPVINNTWFHRVWCIQELVRAKRPILITRTQSIPWDKFAKAVGELKTQFMLYNVNRQFDEKVATENFYFLHDLREKYKKRKKERHTLLELLFLTRGFQATDSRDKLFALVGLAGDVLSSDWEVMANYNLSVAEVYHRFALWSLTRRKQLEILSFGRNLSVSPSPGLEDLPSWVPDLQRLDASNPLPKLKYLSTDYIDVRYDVMKEFQLRKEFFQEGVKVFHADLKYPTWAFGFRSKFDPARIAFSDGAATLNVVGVKIGAIETVGTPLSQARTLLSPQEKAPNTERNFERDVSSMNNHNALHVFNWIYEILELVTASTGQEKSSQLSTDTLDAAWRTITCCMTETGHNAQHTIHSRAAKLIYKDFLERKKKSDVNTAENAKERNSPNPQPDSNTQKLLMMISMSASKWCQSRRFSVTDSGDFAAVPEGAREGDIICIFNGGRVPYVLRRAKNGTYTLVGECYVDGMMRGEVKDRFPAKKHERNFAIR